MEPKSIAIKLTNFKEELLPSGRKLLHCIFENKYGNSRFYYSWTAPWKDKEGEYGVIRVLSKALEIEEWNDYESAWSDELRKISKEIPSLEEMELPVIIQMGGITEDIKEDEENIYEYWKICVKILSNKEDVTKHEEGGKDFIKIGNINMAWHSLKNELFFVNRVKFLSKRIESITEWNEWHNGWSEVGICFWVWIEQVIDRTEHQVIAREIASCIRRFIRCRLSDYKKLKRGFEDQE